MLRGRLFLVMAISMTSVGCGASLSQRPVKSDAELGRVIVYRSGVAYFERHARVKDGKLTLKVPAERVDDFLKSLRVREAKSGRSLPVSFPTLVQNGDMVELTIQLPKDAAREVAVTYVTESAAWKPSYRIELGKQGRGRLEAWAIVDNVSGEDWEKVAVGVGSTSALSFKYDLHSVRFVERETLDGDAEVAAAPPEGGSPYAVANRQVAVAANIALDDVDRLASGEDFMDAELNGRVKPTTKARHSRAPATEPRPDASAAGKAVRGGESSRGIAALAQKLKKSGQRVRIEGYAKPQESDARGAALYRANSVRDALLRNGVSPAQLETVATGRVSDKDGVRLVTVPADQKPAQAKNEAQTSSASSNEPIGSALFVAKTPLSLEKDRSAMLSMLSADTSAAPIYYYDPISVRGNKRFAFRAVRLENPSEHTLDAGPFTVYAEGQFLGEGLSEPIPPKSTAFIPFALDKQLVVDPVVDSREEIDRLVTIQRGIVTTQAQSIRRTKLELANRGEKPADVYIRHFVPEGWKLRPTRLKVEKLRGAHFFSVTVPARGALEVEIEESQPLTKTIDISTDQGVESLALFLTKSKAVEPELQKQLDEIVRLHKEMVDTGERISTLESQMATYRERVDEIHVQLVTLRRVNQADKLSRHLAKKMDEISDRLQKATIEVTDLKGQLMTSRVALADRLAELTLKKDKDDSAVAKK